MRAEAIIDLAEQMGCEKIQRGTRSVVVSCPLAPWTHESGTDRHPGCSIIIADHDRSGWRCHACGGKGTLGWLVTKWGLLSKRKVEKLFRLIEKEEEGIEAVHSRLDRKYEERWSPPDLEPEDDPAVFAEVEAETFMGQVPQYALDRGIALDTCRDWQLGYDEGFGKSPIPRLVFPIRRSDGALVGMVGRAIYDYHRPKYLNYWHFPKSNYLYGLNKLVKREKLIIVEGMIDVLRWWEYGLPVVGLLGAIPSKAQIQLALEFERVYFALDRDEAGENGERLLANRLTGRLPIYRVRFPDGIVDPKDCSYEEAHHAVETARRIL
jgi:hypothetical protein